MEKESQPKRGRHREIFTDSEQKVIKLVVDEEMGLLDFIRLKLHGISRNKVKSILTHRCVTVDGSLRTLYDFQVQPGMLVEINREYVKSPAIHFEEYFAIVYEDPYLMVIDKSDGVLSMGVGENSLNMKYLLDKYFSLTHQHCRAHVVHRLDTRTSGLLIYAKSMEVQQMLIADWHATVKDRRYVAVVENPMEEDSGHIESWLKDTKSLKVTSCPVDNGGKWSSTDWWVLKSNDLYSLIELHLNTGRKNQIRAHMEWLGHPIVGDVKYSAETDPISRLCLHAFRLAFVHPITEEILEFETPFPASFLELMERKPLY